MSQRARDGRHLCLLGNKNKFSFVMKQQALKKENRKGTSDGGRQGGAAVWPNGQRNLDVKLIIVQSAEGRVYWEDVNKLVLVMSAAFEKAECVRGAGFPRVRMSVQLLHPAQQTEGSDAGG